MIELELATPSHRVRFGISPLEEAMGAVQVILGLRPGRVAAGVERAREHFGTRRPAGLATSTVSAHLTALRGAAGILATTRSGHQVRYRRTDLGESLLAGLR
jgi:DNA-binding transcriptional ArsR family regulator